MNTARDPDYLEFVREQVCRLRVFMGAAHTCMGPREAHHPRDHTGLALKADDSTAICLCRLAHRQLHSCAGSFRHMPRQQRKDWEADQVTATRALWLGYNGR